MHAGNLYHKKKTHSHTINARYSVTKKQENQTKMKGRKMNQQSQ